MPMVRERGGRDVIAVVVALVIALPCSTVVRTVTAELTGTVGRVWPFSLVQEAADCHDPCATRVRMAGGMPTR